MRNKHQLQKYDFSTPEGRRHAWTEILQSGTYEQTDGKLRDPGTESEPSKYCCLGVACDIYKRVTGEGQWVDIGFRFPDNEIGVDEEEWDGSDENLPDAVARWYGFGLTAPNPQVIMADIRTAVKDFLMGEEIEEDMEIGAAQANDDYHLTFEQIGKAFAARFKREAELEAKAPSDEE